MKKSPTTSAAPLAAFAVQDMAAVDGSRLSLQPFARGLLREITVPDGRVIKTAFTLLNNRMGMVSGEGSGNVVGMFALEGATLNVIYADGGSDSLMVEGGKSVSWIAQKVEGGQTCTAWYPAGHVFTADERKAALANYAKRLGLKLTRAEQKYGDCAAMIAKLELARKAASPLMDRAEPAPKPAPPAVSAYSEVAPLDHVSPEWDAFYSSFVAPHEGGYAANDGNGFPANYGINQGANPDVDVAGLTQPDAKQILYQRYWLASGADRLPSALAMVHGDTAINMGVRAANDLLAQAQDDPLLYLDLRAERYRAIAAANPDKAGYLSIWLARVDDLRATIGGSSSPQEPLYAEYPPGRGRTGWATDDRDGWDD